MLYLCGSDLESGNSQGTATIENILRSGFSRDAVNVVALLGGTEQWRSDYDPSVLSLITFDDEQNVRILDTWPSASMGAPATLTAFLEFCHDRFPAQRYDLILWDHGGGPNEGVCWDEIYTDDFLSVTELLEALADSPFREKGLDILCFDACLMGSAEVAVQAAAFAKYMVATEDSMYGSPADWLNGIDEETSFDTAKRWVDGCFDYNVAITERQKGSPVVAVSLVDLAYAADLKQAADAFFGPVSEAVSVDSFTTMAGQCRQATVFGVMSSGGKSEYDLMDLGDLVRQYRDIAPAQADRLLEVIRSCVPYQRSVTPGATGLTVYHPMYNKAGAVSWMPVHSHFSLSELYSEYIMRFVSVLTGTPLAKWEKLVAIRAPGVRDNRILFTLTLTREQAAHLSDADMIVLRKNEDETWSFAYHNDGTLPQGDTVTGEYNGMALYAVDDSGNPMSPPLPFRWVDGSTVQIPAVMAVKGTEEHPDFEAKAIVTCDYDAQSKQLTPGAVALWNERMGVYTAANTRAFGEYDEMRISPDARREVRDGAGTLRAFDEWEIVSEDEWAGTIDGGWTFRMQGDPLDPAALYAVFEVTDSQMNRYCSEPRPLRTALAGADEVIVDYDDLGLVRIGSVTLTALNSYCLLSVNVKNISGSECLITLESLALNQVPTGLQTAAYGSGASGSLLPEEEQTVTVMVPFSLLSGADAVSGMTFDLILTSAGSSETLGTVPVSVALHMLFQ